MPKKRALSVFMLAMINVAAVCNIANLSISAENGFSALFYLGLASLFFFIPVALVSAELATGWPQKGGVYIWVKAALNTRFGFLAIWLQWVENIIWYPAVLSFVAATFAYIFKPDLAESKLYIMITVLITYWTITLINFFGMRISGWISTICALVGALLPGILIIFFGISWLALKNPSFISYDIASLFPKADLFKQLGFLSGIMLSLGGLEMSANHAKDVQNPKRNYPLAILISTILIFTIYALGSLSIATVIPKEKINLAAGSIEAFKIFFNRFHLSWAVPIISLLVTIGALGTISTWIVGPTRGLLATAEHGELPPFLQKTNRKDMPISLLIIQAGIVTLLSLVFLFMPSVSSSYWILFCLAAQLYLLMYILMFISAIVLRYKKPTVNRTFKLPFKNIGMWVVAGLGTIGSAFGFIMGFFPPEPFKNINSLYFNGFLLGGILLFLIIPLIITYKKHPSWHEHYLEKLEKEKK